MARKKKTTKINLSIFKYGFIIALSLACVFLVCWGIYQLASESTLFQIKKIEIDDSILFMNKNIFAKIEGQNIFKVDLKKLEKRLAFRYPQISDLKVIRLFPDRLLITAKKRLPFVQTMVNNVLITIDDEGVVVSTKSSRDQSIPFILGIDSRGIQASLGQTVSSKELRAVLLILKRFEATDTLSAYDVSKVHIESFSRIHLYLTNDLVVLMDSDKVSHKLKALGIFLSSKKVDIARTEYVDLRFKDIILKEKNH